MMPINITSSVTIITSLLLIAIAMAVIYFTAKTTLTRSQRIKQRLAGNHNSTETTRSGSRGQFLENLGNHLTLPDADEIRKIRYNLARAGFYSAASVNIFFVARLLCVLGSQILFILSWHFISPHLSTLHAMFIVCALAVLGLFAPGWFIRWRQNVRTRQAKNGFPDMMDLMVASLEAGLGLDATLLRVTEEIGARYPVLKINLDLMNMELRAGRDRHVAMAGFADRINLDEAKALAVILKQSEEMGSNLGAALRTFSSEMRTKRMLKAEEKAMALSAKLTVPLIVFIFPAIMVMLLLPAGVRIAAGLN